ncbi:proline iminopeptidase [Novimethylophilus kurashikiensis]|uniref:Proline iminopeptidase n=1 Tax=Novimethylophilus kurashikiensis TaxID=1825523 RepID=A0A2R5FCL1_9PROT|nr:prolyl aminopeptidase [Novimethylophilus kurashikiensis]GBG15298.1 proline iminopeptidase [Novimethylophilus kurashikiensis]
MPNPSESIVFPALEPHNTAWLHVSALHQICYEECGNPVGLPIIVLHGGPGSGCSPNQRRFFDPRFYRIILFDQRGCGRSQPAGCTEDNTTQTLIEDIERLRSHLGIERWIVFGGSWGSTLALAYAAKYADKIAGLILRGIFLARPEELDWFLNDVRRFFPEAWNRLVDPLQPEERLDILEAFHRRIFNAPEADAVAAAKHWNSYEASIMTLLPPEPASNQPTDNVMLARARVQLHYLMNGCFLSETPLLNVIDSIRHIPAVIIQGRYDMVCPPVTALELHDIWPEAELQIIPDAGHAAFEPGIATALIEATERFKSLVAPKGRPPQQ